MAREPGVFSDSSRGPLLSPGKNQAFIGAIHPPPASPSSPMLGSFHDGVLLVTARARGAPNGFIAEFVASGAKVSAGPFFDGDLSGNASRRWPEGDGLHAFVQRDAPAFRREPGPVPGALESRRPLFTAHRRRGMSPPHVLDWRCGGARAPHALSDGHAAPLAHEEEFESLGTAITVRDGQLPLRTQEGALAGSRSHGGRGSNCVGFWGFLGAGLRYAHSTPADFLGPGQSLGRLAPDIEPTWWRFATKDYFGLRRLGSRAKIGLPPRR